MNILSQAHCPITYHFKIGAIEASHPEIIIDYRYKVQ
jgi:hypothetical protein